MSGLKRLIFATVLLAAPAFAAEPVRRVAIEVQPYYQAAREADAAPHVAVGKTYDALLSSAKREDILAARDLILAKPEMVTPMTMMVLAIRLYDGGLRDDAVFWFYVAKDRYIVLSEVLDVRHPGLAQVDQATRDFATLAGPVINGYAFCDLKKQQEAHAKAVEWVAMHPYAPVFMERLPALPGDRGELALQAVAAAYERAAKERAYFADAKNRELYYATRKKNEMDAKFCWQ